MSWPPTMQQVAEVIARAYRRSRRGDRGRAGGSPGDAARQGAGAQGAGTGLAGYANMALKPWGSQSVAEAPVRRTSERVGAWKWAHVMDHFAGGLSFRGVSIRLDYGAEADAVCAQQLGLVGRLLVDRLEAHDVPALECGCGFYGLKREAVEQRLFNTHTTPFMLEAEFSGRVIGCELGYRAQKIRVLSVRVPRICHAPIVTADGAAACDPAHGCGEPLPCSGDLLLVWNRREGDNDPTYGSVWCDAHIATPTADGFARTSMTLPEAAQSLGTEVRWES